MVRELRRTTSRGIAWCAALAVFVVASSALALDLRVQARSQLTVEARTAGTSVLVSGELRDDLGQPLPQRSVHVEAVREDSNAVPASAEVRTRRDGSYRRRLEVPPGEYLVRVTFEATPHLASARSRAGVRVDEQPVDLEVRAPSLVRSSSRSVPVEIRASIEGEGLPLPVAIRTSRGVEDRLKLDEAGRGRYDVSALLEPGSNRIVVTVPEGAYRDAVNAAVQIRRAESVRVEAQLEAVFERLQRGAAVHGKVTAGGAPVGDVSLEVQMRRVDGGAEARSERAQPVTKSVKTEPDGRFHVFFGRDRLEDGTWRGRVVVEPDVGSVWSREVGTLKIDRTLSRMVVDGAAGLAVLAILFVGARESWRVIRAKLEELKRQREQSERIRRAFEEEATLEPVSVPDAEQGAPDSRARDCIRGAIWDAWRDEPVAGASVELLDPETERPSAEVTTDERGAFEFDEVREGEWELVVEAEYFVRGRFSFEIPHDGTLNPCRFELVPVPLKIRRLYQSLIQVAAGDDLWGELSPRQIRETMQDVLDVRDGEGDDEGPERFSVRIRAIAEGKVDGLETGRDYLEALTELVEETYFGPRQYGEATWRVARDVAVALRDELPGADVRD